MNRRSIVPMLAVVTLLTLTAGFASRHRAGDSGPPAYRFVVAPGEDPGRLALTFSDACLVELDQAGNVIVHGHREEHPGRPRAYQRIAGPQRDVSVRFVMRQDGNIGFALGPYDRTQALTIEPR